MKKIAIIGLILLSTSAIYSLPTQAGWDPTENDQQTATDTQTVVSPEEIETTITAFKAKDPSMQVFFEKAYGYAVFPNIGKGAFIFGGAYGEGNVYERNVLVGSSTVTQLNIGLQAGGQAYSEIVFFKDKDTLDDFKSGNFKFGAQVSAVAATAGASADADYNKGVAIFTLAKGGLMVEASVGGQKFDFTPLVKTKVGS